MFFYFWFKAENWKFLVNKPILKFWFMFIFQQTWWIKNRGRNTIRYLNSSEKNSFGKNYKNGSLTVTFFTIACLPQWVKIFFFYVWFKSKNLKNKHEKYIQLKINNYFLREKSISTYFLNDPVKSFLKLSFTKYGMWRFVVVRRMWYFLSEKKTF